MSKKINWSFFRNFFRKGRKNYLQTEHEKWLIDFRLFMRDKKYDMSCFSDKDLEELPYRFKYKFIRGQFTLTDMVDAWFHLNKDGFNGPAAPPMPRKYFIQYKLDDSAGVFITAESEGEILDKVMLRNDGDLANYEIYEQIF